MACYDRELLRLLPRVLRARDFHLYLEGGKRLVDLWRAGGRAVLGHKPPHVVSELKNSAERGLFTPLPHPLERRFIKALSQFFPGRAFRLYQDEASLCRVLEKAGIAPADIAGPFNDPAFPSRDTEKGISLWRPFLEKKVTDTFFMPVLPWPLGPAVLVPGKDMEDSFPPGELIPPVLLAPAARALHDLAAALKTFSENHGGPAYPKIEKALNKAQSDGSEAIVWRRRGIYLTVEPGMDREEYVSLFRNFLEGGFLIPPSPAEPAILPLVMSPGEESKLAQLLVN